MADLIELAERVERGEGADRELDAIIWCAVEHPGQRPQKDFFYTAREEWGYFTTNQPLPGMTFHDAPHLTDSLDAVVALLERVLPGFWWRGGTCFLSSEAVIAPDRNCPKHGKRLMAECPPSLAHWNEGIEVEIRPGSHGALVRSLLAAILRALAAKEPS